MEISQDNLSTIWHDLNNHISTIEKMNKLENKNDYLNDLKNELRIIPNTINTGNNLIDIILNDKYIEATSHNIIFNIKALAPPDLVINNLDLSSILFNTIDNSIEACLNTNLENKYIDLEIYPENNFLYYKIKNNYKLKGKNDKKIYLNKKDYISKGYGLRIIKNIIKKYDGYLDINQCNGEYLVIIILHLNKI